MAGRTASDTRQSSYIGSVEGVLFNVSAVCGPQGDLESRLLSAILEH